MRAWLLPVVCLLVLSSESRVGRAQEDLPRDAIIAAERAALDRWGKGDPEGYLQLYADELTYFDPTRERRVDGAAALRELLRPIAGKVKIDRYEMLNPTVQRHGDTAVLTFNVVNYRRLPDGTEHATTRWNTTEVYQRTGDAWKIIHSHWSYTKP